MSGIGVRPPLSLSHPHPPRVLSSTPGLTGTYFASDPRMSSKRRSIKRALDARTVASWRRVGRCRACFRSTSDGDSTELSRKWTLPSSPVGLVSVPDLLRGSLVVTHLPRSFLGPDWNRWRRAKTSDDDFPRAHSVLCWWSSPTSVAFYRRLCYRNRLAPSHLYTRSATGSHQSMRATRSWGRCRVDSHGGSSR